VKPRALAECALNSALLACVEVVNYLDRVLVIALLRKQIGKVVRKLKVGDSSL
jgi:hypothetical protein